MSLSVHPSAGLVAGLRWVFEDDTDFTLVRLAHIGFHSEPAIVHHSLNKIQIPQIVNYVQILI